MRKIRTVSTALLFYPAWLALWRTTEFLFPRHETPISAVGLAGDLGLLALAAACLCGIRFLCGLMLQETKA